MLHSVQAGPYCIRGVSVGGLYTSLHLPELGALLDVGIAARSCAGAPNVFLTHGHADHIGALGSLLGLRQLGRLPPPRLFMPAQIADDVRAAVAVLSRLQDHDWPIDAVAVEPGDEHQLRSDLWVRAFAAHHVVPCVGYEFLSRVQKLRPQFHSVPGPEIARRRMAGEPLFETVERVELGYATDSQLRVIDTHPSLRHARVLILECTFLDQRKTVNAANDWCHVHLDDLLARFELGQFANEALVLVHFSQSYSPEQVHEILQRRCPEPLLQRLVPFAPSVGPWPG